MAVLALVSASDAALVPRDVVFHERKREAGPTGWLRQQTRAWTDHVRGDAKVRCFLRGGKVAGEETWRIPGETRHGFIESALERRAQVHTSEVLLDLFFGERCRHLRAVEPRSCRTRGNGQ